MQILSTDLNFTKPTDMHCKIFFLLC